MKFLDWLWCMSKCYSTVHIEPLDRDGDCSLCVDERKAAIKEKVRLLGASMNWGERIAIANVLLGAGASVGFLFAADWRRSLCFALGAAITYVATFLLR